MTRITRITLAALATLAIVAPVATAMPSDGPGSPYASIRPQTSTAVSPQSGASDTCAQGSRAVHGPAGIGCTTSPSSNSDEFGVFAVIVASAAAFAIALGARVGGGRRRGRASTAAAFSERTS
jgi:hypothetical protein